MLGTDLAREATRNKVLRRADWRFLLPNPQPARSICFADGLLAQAVEMISGQTMDARQAPAGECDLAVAVDPDSATLRAIWSALRTGGMCYTEWYSPLAGGPNRIRHRLQSLGFERVTCAWPWPWPSRASAQFWLPPDAPGTLDWFLSHRAPAQGVARRAGHAVRRTVWRLSARMGLLLPVCVIARKPVLSTAAETDWLECIRSGWAGWGFGSPPDNFSWLLLTGGQRSINKVVGLVSAGREGAPRLIVKMPRVPEAIPALKREAMILQAVHAQRPGVPGVPQVLFCRESDSFITLGETILTGVPLYTQLRRDTFRHLALKVTDWLADLAGRPEPSSRAAWWSRLGETVLADFLDTYGAVLDRVMLQETTDVLTTLGDLPLVCEQRDFSPWNVLINDGGDLVVLDWESAEVHGFPALDLIYFLTYLSFFLDGAMESGRFRESYRDALNPSTFTGAVVADCLTRYCARTGLDPTTLKPLRLLAWMLHARSEYERFAADTGGKPDPDNLRRGLFMSLWQEELRHLSRRNVSA